MSHQPKNLFELWTDVEDLPPQKMVIKPWLETATTTLIYAPRGHGKSMFCYHLALAIATGGSWLGERAQKSKVLYIDGEMGSRQWVKRMPQEWRFTEDLTGNLQILCPDHFPNGRVPNMAEKCTHKDYKIMAEPYDVVIVDNYLSCCRQGSLRGEADMWDAFCDLLINLKQKNKAVIVIQHTNKSGQQYGTIKKENDVDTALLLTQFPIQDVKNGITLQMTNEKDRNDFFDKEKELLFDMIFHPEGTKTVIRDIHREREIYIREKIRYGLTSQEIAEELFISVGYVKKIKSKIEENQRKEGRNGATIF